MAESPTPRRPTGWFTATATNRLVHRDGRRAGAAGDVCGRVLCVGELR